MFDQRRFGTILLTALALVLAGCASTPGLVSIQITPTTEYFGGPGLTAQFTAIGTYAQGDHPLTTRDITSLVMWKSNATAVATVGPTGVATSGYAFGSTDITASMNGFTGLVTAHATVIVCTLDPSNPNKCSST